MISRISDDTFQRWKLIASHDARTVVYNFHTATKSYVRFTQSSYKT